MFWKTIFPLTGAFCTCTSKNREEDRDAFAGTAHEFVLRGFINQVHRSCAGETTRFLPIAHVLRIAEEIQRKEPNSTQIGRSTATIPSQSADDMREKAYDEEHRTMASAQRINRKRRLGFARMFHATNLKPGCVASKVKIKTPLVVLSQYRANQAHDV